jgi:hypothetical protein
MNLLLEVRIVQARTQLGVGDFVQDLDRTVVRSLPGQRREFTEYFLGLWIPGPPEITRENLKAFGKWSVTAVAHECFCRRLWLDCLCMSENAEILPEIP